MLKKKVSIGFLLLFTMIIGIVPLGGQNSGGQNSYVKKILLQNQLVGSTGRPRSGDIDVSQTSTTIKVDFLDDMGEVFFKISKNGVRQYQTWVETSWEESITINTAAWSAGTYLIEITLEDGSYLTGEFILE